MGFVSLTKTSLEAEHICCALGAKQYESAVCEKKQWLAGRMDEGLVFRRLDERAKVFIEYMPAAKAWVPIHAPNYMMIHCLWVSGKYKQNGYAKQLLDFCKEDAVSRGMDGIVHVVGNKNYPYLSDKRFFEHMGFKMVDQAEPYFQLAALTWNPQAADPSFAKPFGAAPTDQGISLYYTAQCPFAVGMADELAKVAANRQVPFTAHRITSREEALRSPLVWTTFGMFYNGTFITHEIPSANKFEKLLDALEEKNGIS